MYYFFAFNVNNYGQTLKLYLAQMCRPLRPLMPGEFGLSESTKCPPLSIGFATPMIGLVNYELHDSRK
jgi:hypothetical protein